MAVRRKEHGDHEAERRDPSMIGEFSDVRLTHDVEHRGTSYPEGTPGVVVHKHDEDAFEVEFSRPRFSVITLTKNDIAPA